MESVIRSVAVFCSSSDAVAPEHFERAKRLGRIIGENGWRLVFGGASVGLMNALGNAARKAGASVVGVVPEFLVKRGIAHDVCDEMIVTKTMAERKTLIGERSDAFVALPGSIGTLE
ncbi:MAG: TIGR00730 family Rossman fold protein, partial [bacterium]